MVVLWRTKFSQAFLGGFFLEGWGEGGGGRGWKEKEWQIQDITAKAHTAILPPPPLKCASCWNFWHRGGGVRFFFSSFSSGVGGGQGELVGTRNNNPDLKKKGFFSWEGEGEGREKKVFFFSFLHLFFWRGGGRLK